MSKHRKYTKELLEPLVKQARSVAQVARMLGMPLDGGSATHLKNVIIREGLDMSHFAGQAWNRGGISHTKKTPEQILINGYERRPEASKTRRAMIESGIPYICVKCNTGPEHDGEPLVLEIDHINNDWSDNRKENVQFMCPNCHSQKTMSDGSKAKFLRSLQSLPTVQRTMEKTSEKTDQLYLGLYQKKPRQSAPDVDWRSLPKPDQRKYERPSKETLGKMVWEKPSYQVALDLGIDDTLLCVWCNDMGVNKPPRGYWNRIKKGLTHEEALAPIIPKQKNPRRHLTGIQIREILGLIKEDRLSLRKIGKLYNVNHVSIIKIRDNESYKNVSRI
jgi:hypothetical protein